MKMYSKKGMVMLLMCTLMGEVFAQAPSRPQMAQMWPGQTQQIQKSVQSIDTLMSELLRHRQQSSTVVAQLRAEFGAQMQQAKAMWAQGMNERAVTDLLFNRAVDSVNRQIVDLPAYGKTKEELMYQGVPSTISQAFIGEIAKKQIKYLIQKPEPIRVTAQASSDPALNQTQSMLLKNLNEMRAGHPAYLIFALALPPTGAAGQVPTTLFQQIKEMMTKENNKNIVVDAVIPNSASLSKEQLSVITPLAQQIQKIFPNAAFYYSGSHPPVIPGVHLQQAAPHSVVGQILQNMPSDIENGSKVQRMTPKALMQALAPTTSLPMQSSEVMRTMAPMNTQNTNGQKEMLPELK